MSERLHWCDAEDAAQWLEDRDRERAILLFLAQLPFASAHVLEQLTGARTTTIYRSLTRLRHRDLIAAVKVPAPAGRSPEHFFLTDLGLASIAVDRGIDLDHLVRRLHLRGHDLGALLPKLTELSATYDLLGALAASRPGSPCLLAWERPWRRRYRRPTAKTPVSVILPAYAALSWDDGHGAYLLLPDRDTLPLRLYRPALAHLVALRRRQYRTFPILLVAATGRRRVEAWKELLAEVGQARRDAPLLTRVVIWEELAAGLIGLQMFDQPLSPEQLTQRVAWRLLGPHSGTRPLPRPVGDAIGVSLTATRHDGLERRSLQLTPSDYALLDLVGHHPFLDREQLAIVLGWETARVRRQRNRLIEHGFLRLLARDEIGDDRLELAELTADGLELWSCSDSVEGLRLGHRPG